MSVNQEAMMENMFQQASVITSEVKTIAEGTAVWQLKNWNDSTNFNFLLNNANCEVRVSDDVSFRFYLKEQTKVADNEGLYKTETNYVSLFVRELLTNPLINKRDYCDVGVGIKIILEQLNQDFYKEASTSAFKKLSTQKPQKGLPGYRSITEPGIMLSFKSGRTLSGNDKLVMEEFILLSQTTTQSKSLQIQQVMLKQNFFTNDARDKAHTTSIHYNKPEHLRYGIKVQLFSCAAQSSTSSSSPKLNKLDLPISTDFERMYGQQDNYSDMKLESRDGMLINAHKFVVAARSSRFRALIEEETKRNDFSGTIKVADIFAKPLMVILKWMYTGKFDDKVVTGGVLEEVIIACGNYEMEDLLKLCEMKMMTVCNPLNMLNLFQLAQKHGMQLATKQISLYIKENIEIAVSHTHI